MDEGGVVSILGGDLQSWVYILFNHVSKQFHNSCNYLTERLIEKRFMNHLQLQQICNEINFSGNLISNQLTLNHSSQARIFSELLVQNVHAKCNKGCKFGRFKALG